MQLTTLLSSLAVFILCSASGVVQTVAGVPIHGLTTMGIGTTITIMMLIWGGDEEREPVERPAHTHPREPPSFNSLPGMDPHMPQSNDIKEGVPCAHEDEHTLVGAGESNVGDQFLIIGCESCGTMWEEWGEWEVGSNNGWRAVDERST